MMLALLVCSFWEDSCCLLPVVLRGTQEGCCPQQGGSGLLGWEQVSPQVPCHLGAVLQARRSPEGAAGAGNKGCTWCSPPAVLSRGGTLGLRGSVAPLGSREQCPPSQQCPRAVPAGVWPG